MSDLLQLLELLHATVEGTSNAIDDLSLAYASRGAHAFVQAPFPITRKTVNCSNVLIRAVAAKDIESVRAIADRIRIDTRHGSKKHPGMRHGNLLANATAWCVLRNDLEGLETLKALFGGTLLPPAYGIEYATLNGRMDVLAFFAREPKNLRDNRPLAQTRRWNSQIMWHLPACDDPLGTLTALIDAKLITLGSITRNGMIVAAARDRANLFRVMRERLGAGRGIVNDDILKTTTWFGATNAFRELWTGYGWNDAISNTDRRMIRRLAIDGRFSEIVAMVGDETPELATGDFRARASDRNAKRLAKILCNGNNQQGTKSGRWHCLASMWSTLYSAQTADDVGLTLRGVADALVDRMRRDGDSSSDWSTFFWTLRHLGYAKGDLPGWVLEGSNGCFQGIQSLCAAFGLQHGDVGVPLAAFEKIAPFAFYTGYLACPDKLFEVFDRRRVELDEKTRDAAATWLRRTCGYGAVAISK